jgi:hypothetical protein
VAKRHTQQSKKQQLGQFFTTNADVILSGYESTIKDFVVVDPFAGDWDLLKWAQRNGCKDVIAYDLDPKNTQTLKNDSLLSPADYTGKFVLTNPPYLSANKSKGKYSDIFAKWRQSDLYKCFIATLVSQGADEALIIIPSNFLCESNSRARELLFSRFSIQSAKYWNEPVFDDATTGVCLLHISKKTEYGVTHEEFDCVLLPENRAVRMQLDKQFGYIHGGEAVAALNRSYEFEKIGLNTNEVNTRIVVGCLDNGKYSLGFHYNQGDPIRVPGTVITTFQVNTVGFSLNEDEQQQVISLANQKLNSMREKYASMFLSNYMGARQKIMSVSIARSFLSDACAQVFGDKYLKRKADTLDEHFIFE